MAIEHVILLGHASDYQTEEDSATSMQSTVRTSIGKNHSPSQVVAVLTAP